jgi:hypothetical protein
VVVAVAAAPGATPWTADGTTDGVAVAALKDSLATFASHRETVHGEYQLCGDPVATADGAIEMRARAVAGQPGSPARGSMAASSGTPVTLKVFPDRAAADREAEVFETPTLRSTVEPCVLEVHAASRGAVSNHATYVLPPVVVLRVTEDVVTWAQRPGSGGAGGLARALRAAARHLDALHSQGIAHRGLRPEALRYDAGAEEWSITNFGASATIGAHLWAVVPRALSRLVSCNLAAGYIVVGPAPLLPLLVGLGPWCMLCAVLYSAVL